MNLRVLGFVFGIAVLITFSASCSFGADWVTIKPNEGEFSAIFPAEPQDAPTKITLGKWTVVNHTFGLARKDGREYLVMWCDYPAEIMAVTSPDRVLAGIIKGYNGGANKVLSDKTMTISGKSGRELVVDMGNGIIHRACFVMSGNRLFQVVVNTPLASKDDPDIAKFFDAFSIIDINDFSPRGFRLEGVDLGKWQIAARDKGKSVVQWISSDSGRNDLHGFITIEAATATLPSAEKTAQGLATDWGGKVTGQQITLDGEPAFKVEASNSTKELRPVEGIVIMHDGYIYLIMGGVVSGGDCSRQIEEIMKGWKWEDFQPASQHLALMSNPVTIFGGLATINYPKDMYVNKPDKPEQIVDLSLYDIQKNIGAFQAYVQLAPLTRGAVFASMKDDFLKRLNSQKMTDTPLEWSARHGDGARQVTAALRSTGLTESLKHDTFVKWALIQLDKEHVVLINFTIAAADEKEKALYEAAANAIVDSVLPRAAATQPGHNATPP